LIFFLAVCSCRILEGFGFVAFFVCVEAISFCIRLSCLVTFFFAANATDDGGEENGRSASIHNVGNHPP